MGGEVVDKVIPHLGVMLVKLLALHCVIGDSERSAGLEHECNSTLGDAHWLQFCRSGSLELGVCNAVRDTTTFVGETTRLEFIRSSTVSTVDKTHELGCDVAVVVRWAVSVACNIPSRREDQDIGERSSGIAGLGGQDGEDGGVDVVDGDRANIDEFGQIILVWRIIPGPGDNIEGIVLLKRSEEFAAKLVDNFVFVGGVERVCCGGIEEISGVGKTVGTERTELGKLEVRSPDFANVTTRWTIDESHGESETSRNDADLTWLNPKLSEFGGDIENSLLRNDEVVTVTVDIGRVCHVFVAHIGVGSDTFPEGWVTRSSNGLDSSDEVDIVSRRDIER